MSGHPGSYSKRLGEPRTSNTRHRVKTSRPRMPSSAFASRTLLPWGCPQKSPALSPGHAVRPTGAAVPRRPRGTEHLGERNIEGMTHSSRGCFAGRPLKTCHGHGKVGLVEVLEVLVVRPRLVDVLAAERELGTPTPQLDCGSKAFMRKVVHCNLLSTGSVLPELMLNQIWPPQQETHLLASVIPLQICCSKLQVGSD